jgi:L-asparaginase II
MSNPVVVEILRGERVESSHAGAGAVVDADGRVALEFGDVERPVFPRSAVKALQALPLIESGAADSFAFTDAEIALACSSHSGEPEHVALAAGILAKAGRDGSALACGAHWPSWPAAARALARAGAEPSALHNNCSGKHAGFVCLSCAEGVPPEGYETPEHFVQREIKATLEDVLAEPLDDRRRGTDGCSIPTYAVSLRTLARGFARFGAGVGFGPARAAAARRIRAAVAAYPFMVGGTDRFDTDVMKMFGARAFTKGGAEGVFCAALPELGLGLAVKADDGASRAAEAMMAALIRQWLPMSDSERASFARFVTPTLSNWRGIEVGAIRPAGPLADI